MKPDEIRWMIELRRAAGHKRLPLTFQIIERLLTVFEETNGDAEIDRDIGATHQAPEVVQ